jgi:predicted RNA binding protein YcfA (HicA-like mRNA interferase family)
MPKAAACLGCRGHQGLEQAGFVKARQSGSHVVLRRGAIGCVVPLHAELKVGTLASLLRQAQVSADEFIEQL